jgi:hypothetical protein
MTIGTIYLIHFERPIGGHPRGGPRLFARHYLGHAVDLEARIAEHRRGQGSRLMAAVAAAGINFVVARTWPGDRALERRLKRRHDSPGLCPMCSGRAGRACAEGRP